MFLSVRHFKMVILKSYFKKVITKLFVLTCSKIYRACVCENNHSPLFHRCVLCTEDCFLNEVKLFTFSQTNYRKMLFNKELNKFGIIECLNLEGSYRDL